MEAAERHDHGPADHVHAAGTHDALNPALAEARFCPRCGAPAEVDYPRSLSCPACGYGAYYNPKPVACAIPVDAGGRLLLLRRGFAPGKDLWTFPGGFVDLGETVEEGAKREVREEVQIEIELGALVGVYSRATDRVMLVVYAARALSHPRPTPEAPGIVAFAAADLPWDQLAFWSTERALQDFLGRGA